MLVPVLELLTRGVGAVDERRKINQPITGLLYLQKEKNDGRGGKGSQ